MQSFINRLLSIESSDPDIQRRGRVTALLGIGFVFLGLAFTPLGIVTRDILNLAIIAVAIGLFIAAVLITRTGRVNLGAWMLIGVTLAAIDISIVVGAPSPSAPFYLILPMLMAAITLSPRQIWFILLINLVATILLFARLSDDVRSELYWQQSMFGAPVLLIATAVLSFVGATSISRALQAANESRRTAELAQEQLSIANSKLEHRVLQRTRDLEISLEQQQRIAAELEASISTQQNLNHLINELSVPIIPVQKGTLVVPLVGGIDSARAEQLMNDILRRVERDQTKRLILDVTGVAIIDTMVAGILLRISDAVYLMGATTVICGIRPEVAQTLVQLGVDLSKIQTVATLQESLSQVLH